MSVDDKDDAAKALALAWFRVEGAYTYAHVVDSDRERMLKDFKNRNPEQWVADATAMIDHLEYEGFTVVKINGQDR